MHIAFGRVRHKTSPTRGGVNVCLFFWFTISGNRIIGEVNREIHRKGSLKKHPSKNPSPAKNDAFAFPASTNMPIYFSVLLYNGCRP